jgi:sulfate permease, SulP family
MTSAGPLVPRLVTCLRTYDRRTAAADVAAGITVGLVALPLAMAFAIASGLSPQAGIYCAIVTGFIVSALGGSRVQIAGPSWSSWSSWSSWPASWRSTAWTACSCAP